MKPSSRVLSSGNPAHDAGRAQIAPGGVARASRISRASASLNDADPTDP